MDTIITSLPSDVGAILMKNVSIIQVVSMFAIGAYNAFETAIVTFDTFKRYSGLYFWSMQVASWGILVHALPAMARFVSQASNLSTSIPFIIGWYAMVTGQAVVLYSRLDLVVRHMEKVRWVLWMIVGNFFILHIPMTVLFFGLNQGDARFARPAAIYDRIQVTGFCVQDFIICGIYIYEAIRILKPMVQTRGRNGRNAIIHLLWINIIVVLLNILLLLTEFKLHYIQVSFKTVVYSIKLKLEFSVFNRLRSLTSNQPILSQYEPEDWRRPSKTSLLDKIFPWVSVTPDRSVRSEAGQREASRGACTDLTEGSVCPGSTLSTRLSATSSNTLPTASSNSLPALESGLSQFSPHWMYETTPRNEQ
ncbi:hypothetical protein N7520_001753 [Penicillium odoratum]|uniref:uncharacterized protein n=1 Tax=Penicillium odoratum TaxID=1167516 RepID=UPI002547D21C|nr:uncharacterized protein N7520_001753 [Penicillium odoratum]KAJ5778507.1 hypothetical protein N7520_001753 [Penicillium odoratum]